MGRTVLLSWDTPLFKSIEARYIGALFVMPVFTLALSMLLTLEYVFALETSTRILVILLVFYFSPYFGWRLNGLMLRLTCGWSRGQTQLVFDEGIFPAHWLKHNGLESLIDEGKEAIQSLMIDREVTKTPFAYAREKALNSWVAYCFLPYVVNQLFEGEFDFLRVLIFFAGSFVIIAVPIFIYNWFKFRRLPEIIKAKKQRLGVLCKMRKLDLAGIKAERRSIVVLLFLPISFSILGALVMLINHHRTLNELPEFYELKPLVVHVEKITTDGSRLKLSFKEYENTLTYEGKRRQILAAKRELLDKQARPVEIYIKQNKFKKLDIYQLSVDGEILLDYQTTIDVQTALFRWGHWFSYLLWLIVLIWVAIGVRRNLLF